MFITSSTRFLILRALTRSKMVGWKRFNMPTTTETWYSVRNGEYFCNDCNAQLVAHSVRESFVFKARLDETVYTCESCGRSVIVPATPMFSN